MCKKILALALALVMTVTLFGCQEDPADPTTTGTAGTPAGQPIEIPKSIGGNPIAGFDDQGNIAYGGDPSVLVDGDTAYLYVGHDTAPGDAYVIPEYLCYSSKDLINWNYEGVVLKMSDVPWADNNSAWAGQVAKHYDAVSGKDKYYFYYCSWNNKDAGKQSIGVAVSESPTGPFVDIGGALVMGSFTTDHTSDWNDIDPTVWIETDAKGVEHRYLAWGNGKLYVCELNEDMVSVKDYNGDGEITFGNKGDIRSLGVPSGYTEGPWLYRRQDESGQYYGPYYCFYASGWRERLAYSTSEDELMKAMWFDTAALMEPATTSNTSHCAVFDFNGKTYMIYHNGSLVKGSGYRRVACIAELHFNDDGTIQFVTETATGIGGTISSITSLNGEALTHAHFVNTNNDADYPYENITVGSGLAGTTAEDSWWEIVPGSCDKTNVHYVSIESYNKAGLYLTANQGNAVLSQDYAGIYGEAQTFKTVSGLAGSGVSFESVKFPGTYLTLKDGKATLTDGSDVSACSFTIATVTE